ncbi:MAG: universal stress protein [Mycobacteriales bacterium]
MTVVIWVVEGTWPACVDAARRRAADEPDPVLLHVLPGDVAGTAHGAFAGLLGRGHRDQDPGAEVERLAAASAAALLDQAERRLGRTARREVRTGRVEREVVAACEGADLLICARDGDRSRLGPRSLGPATRFVVDHAPCPVLLVWPERAPALDSIPPPPPRGGPPHP